MKTMNYVKLVFFAVCILFLSKTANSQISFEVDLPGIHIVAGEPYPVIIAQPQVIYYEPLPEGYYYYDAKHDCYYNDDGYVYYNPPNVIKHDNGKHKGWYKNKHKHHKDDDDQGRDE